MQANFVKLVEQGASPQQIADVAARTWHAVDIALSPIIGQRGVAALYKRALYIVRADYPWLISGHREENQFGDFHCLRSLLTQQTSATAAAANLALYQAFYDLLSSLIGAALTRRLLNAIPDYPSNGDAAQDPSS